MTEDRSGSSAVRVRDMPWLELMALLRSIGPEIGRLMQNGDQTAKMVMAYYVYAREHPNDQKANLNLRTAVEDYINRDLRDAENIELGSKYGHKLEEPDPGPRIFVPGGPTRQ